MNSTPKLKENHNSIYWIMANTFALIASAIFVIVTIFLNDIEMDELMRQLGIYFIAILIVLGLWVVVLMLKKGEANTWKRKGVGVVGIAAVLISACMIQVIRSWSLYG